MVGITPKIAPDAAVQIHSQAHSPPLGDSGFWGRIRDEAHVRTDCEYFMSKVYTRLVARICQLSRTCLIEITCRNTAMGRSTEASNK